MQRNAFADQIAFLADVRGPAPAVDAGDRVMSYADLDAAANRLARAIRGRLDALDDPPVPPIVGLHLAAGADYVVALLATVRAGAAFLPLPPDSPPQRLAAMMDTARAALIVTDGSGRLPAETAALHLRDPAVDRAASTPPGITAKPGDPAYVMFTSGSTGAPKGILGQHRGLSHFLKWEVATFGLGAETRGSWLAPPTFDVSLRDILVPLMAGGTVVIPDADTRTMPHRLAAWLADRRISLVHIVPTLLRLLTRALPEGGTDPLPALTHLLSAGEPLLAGDVAAWRAKAGDRATVVNLYGPSETTLAKLYHRVDALPADPAAVLPIGRPLPQTDVRVMTAGRPCAVGEIGEIHIRTPYRSLGYLHAPDLTRAAFLPTPDGDGPGDWLYRTGDLGRLRADGLMECLGRLDQQIKIAGVRFELAEIEAALRRIPGVALAAARLFDQTAEGGGKLLAGYVTRTDGSTDPLPPEDVRTTLQAHLPSAAIPQTVTVLARMPRTVSGKVNRKSLPTPEDLFYASRTYVAPEGPTEAALAALWGRLFGRGRIGVTIPFGDYGGDSLKAITAVQGIWEACGAEVTLAEFFRAPTIRDLARLIDGRSGHGLHGRPIPPAAPASDDPLSPAQKRLWQLDRMGIAGHAYNLPEAYALTGPLDAEALEAALRAVIARHEALRTVFTERDGLPRQRVQAAAPWRLERLDYRDEADLDAALAAAMAANARHRFDLAAGPPVRCTLIRLPDAPGTGEPRHGFLFNLHHIVGDLWSLGVMVREIAEAYEAFAAGTEPAWAPLRLQHRDVVAWQAGRLAGGALEAARASWHTVLSAPLPTLDLPADRPRPPVQSFAGTTRRVGFGRPLTDAIDRLAAAGGAGRFAVLTALIKAWLHRLTGQPDLILGSPVANRDHPDLADQVGYLVNTVALRTRVEPGWSVADLIAAVAETVQGALAHQAYPFDRLVEDLDLPRDMSRSPLFDVMVVYQGFEDTAFTLDGLTIEPLGPENAWSFSRYDLVFHLQDGEHGLILDLNYATDLFDADRIARVCDQFLALAHLATDDPGRRLAALPVPSPAEAEAIAGFERGPARPLPDDATLPGLMRTTAARVPDRPALAAQARVLTYREVMARVQALAGHLTDELGVAPGARIAVLADRTLGSAIALLAILEAGAAYVPIYRTLPPARMARMLAIAEVSAVLLDTADDARLLPRDAGIPTVAVDGFVTGPVPAPAADRPHRADPDALAYLIFTSGSTGEPKAVEVPHRGVVNMVHAQIVGFGIAEADRVQQFAAPSFDASIANLYMAWGAGAAVVLPDREDLESTEGFRAALRRDAVTVTTLPPTFLRALYPADLSPLRVLISAGEAAPVTALCHYAERLAAFNAYGPTEASVCASLYRVRPEDARLPRLPIGTPLANTGMRILDADLAPAAIGVDGDLYLSGVGLARGYRGRPDLTARAFITDPATGERLYRTGDRARWRGDGTVDLTGRADAQVKIAGHRVEPGEVEHALRGLPGVSDAHVAPVTRADGSLALAAWWVRRPGIELWPSIAEFYVYDDVTYGAMAADEGRNSRYRAAFARHLPGKTVLDVGTGPLAILARLAVDAGAAHVFAVDLSAETVAKARATVAGLGLADRITVLHGDAATLTLPRPVDWCISEIVGAIGGSEGAAKILNAVRGQLADPGHMLPRRTVTRIAALASPVDGPPQAFPPIAAHYVERIFEQVGRPFDLRLCLKGVTRDLLISDTGVFEDLDHTVETPLESDHAVRLTIERAATLTGFLVWLDLEVDAGLTVDILEFPGSWLPVWLPAFPDGVAVGPGDTLDFTVRRRLNPNGLNPDFTVEGALRRTGAQDRPFRYVTAHYGQGFRVDPWHARLFADGPDGWTVPVTAGADTAGLRHRLAEVLPSYARPAYLTEVDALLRTANDKVDAARLPDPLATVQVAATADGEPETPHETVIRHVCQRVLGVETIGPEDDFFRLGGDSIRAIRLVGELRRAGLKLEVRDLFQNPTVAGLADVAEPLRGVADQTPLTGPVPLSPIQRWFAGGFGPAATRFTMAVMVHGTPRLDPDAVAKAVQALWQHHDMLRARVAVDADGGFHQDVAGPDTLAPFEIARGEALPAVAERLHDGFAFDGARPLFRAVLVPAEARDSLLLAAHHWVVDAVSWRILLEDLADAYGVAVTGCKPVLPPRTDSYRAWVERLHGLADARDWTESRAAWRRLPAASPLPTDRMTAQPPLVGDRRTSTLRLDPDGTARLLAACRDRERATVSDLLLAALARAGRSALGADAVTVTLETHGRDRPVADAGSFVELDRTVGWFTSFHPVTVPGDGDPLTTLTAVRQTQAALPDRGLSALLIDRLGEGLDLPSADIALNHLGDFGGNRLGDGLEVDWEVPGNPHGEHLPRPHAWELSTMITGGCLDIGLDWDSARTEPATAERLLGAFADALVELTDALDTTATAGSRPFSLGDVSDADLDELLDAD